jgi:hypothetical protein
MLIFHFLFLNNNFAFTFLHCFCSQNFKLAHYKSVAELGALKSADRGIKKTVLASITSQYERHIAAERQKLTESFAQRRVAFVSQ